MSWFNGQILSREEVLTSALNDDIPASLGPGDECSLYIQMDEQEPSEETLQGFDGYVVGVSIKQRHAIYFDVALPIKGTLFYAVIKDVRGWVRSRGEKTDPTGDLVSVQAVNAMLDQPENRRKLFHLVEPE